MGIQGSIDEDAAPRWLNHFYDPIFERGLDTPVLLVNGYPAKNWGLYSKYQLAKLGQTGTAGVMVAGLSDPSSMPFVFSYEAGIERYAKSSEKDAYLTLGHILHLIEDLTVPEHVRNDAHPGEPRPSYYENWTKDNSAGLTQNLGKRLFVKGDKPVIYSDLESYFNNLATYTNTHFFSPRTINSEIYLKPKIVFEDGTFAYGRDENGELFDLAYYTKDFITQKNTYFLNDEHKQVLQEYWLRLSRQAVVNGAGVIGLFLNQATVAREAELAKQKTESQQLTKKSSFLSQIINFFKSPEAPASEPALVIKSEPRRDVGAQPTKPSPKIVIQETAVKPTAVQKPAALAPIQPKPVPNPAPIPTPATTAQTPVPAPAPAPAPQTSAPVYYGGGGGSTSLTTSGGVTNTVVQTPNQEQSSGTGQAFQAGDLVINEIMYDLEGSDTLNNKSREWVEIYNNSGREITLTGGTSGWRFSDGSKHFLNEPAALGSMAIPIGGYAVLAGDAATFLADHSGFTGTVIDTVMSLRNSTSTIKIVAPDGTVIDEVTYYNSWGANGDGKTLERKSAAGGSNYSVNWAQSSAPGGTPGAPNNWELLMSDINNSTSTTPSVLGLGTDVSATTTIAANTTWTLTGSPYRLFFDGQRRPTVAAGAVLTIEPGVKIISQGGGYTALEIQGTLSAIATSGAPIIFTSIKDGDGLASTTPETGEWLNIAFSPGSQGNLDYTEFRYGGQGLERPVKEMVKAIGATVNINHSTFTNSQSIALRLVDSNGVIENSTFTDSACGISIDSLVNGDGTTNGGCAGSSGYFPAAATTTPQIRNNQFIKNRLVAVETRNGATPILDGNIFTDNGYPVRIESSYPTITNSQIANSTTSPNILNGIAIDGYTHFRKNFTLKKDLPYILETNGPALSPYIDASVTLTLEPGTIFKTNNTSSTLFVYGSLIASTTPDNPIVFTSLKDDARGGDTNGDGSITSPQNNDWANIKFLSGSIGNFMNAIFSYGGYGYIAPPPQSPVVLFTESFDGYSTGPLSGQSDWGGGNSSDQIAITSTTTHDGTNSVRLSGGSGAYTYRTLIQPITESGTLSFWIYYNSLGNQSIGMADSNGNLVASIYYDSGNNNCSTSDGNCWALIGDGGIGNFTRTSIQTTVGAWHFMELEMNFSNHEVRVRQDAGSWSNWVGSNRSNLGRIRFDRGTGDVFYDTFVYSKPASTIPDNPALSIDSGASVVVQ